MSRAYTHVDYVRAKRRVKGGPYRLDDTLSQSFDGVVMRIAVDAREIYAPNRRGTGKNLIDLYMTLAAQRPRWEFIMLFQTSGLANPFEQCPNVRAHRVDIRGDRWNLWQDVRLPFAARALGADLLHCPTNTSPLRSLIPVVVTIHDLIPDYGDEAASRTLRRVRRSARLARHIITPSYYTRRIIVSQLEMPEEKITVNYWAPCRTYRCIDDAPVLAAIRQKFGVPSDARCVLAFGAEDPRKNTSTIIQSWAELSPSIRERSFLLMVGLQPSALERARALAARLISDGSCLLHGFADEADIAPLLSAAAVLCYPSRSEGFGLPVLDAFACGTPVITSQTTSLPEVAGDAAILVDPSDPRDIGRALRDVLGSETLRARLREQGFDRLRLFSWDRCADTAAKVFEAVAQA
jgi:glycosyltransferase involved in cell wall biosynthesis